MFFFLNLNFQLLFLISHVWSLRPSKSYQYSSIFRNYKVFHYFKFSMNIKKSEWWPTVIVYCRMDMGFIEPENNEIPLCCCFCNWYVSKIHRYHILYENNKSVHVSESYFNSQYKPWHKMKRYIISNLEDSYLIIFLSLLFFF